MHGCLLHDCSFPCMTACRLCLWGTCVSPYFRITSLGRPFLVDCLCCLGVIPNCLPSTKLGFGIRSNIRAISMYGSTMETLQEKMSSLTVFHLQDKGYLSR